MPEYVITSGNREFTIISERELSPQEQRAYALKYLQQTRPTTPEAGPAEAPGGHEPEPPAPPPPDVGGLLRLGNVFAYGGLKGVLDAPANVLNALAGLAALPFGGLPEPPFRSPTEAYGRAVGFQPPHTATERVLAKTGEGVGGALLGPVAGATLPLSAGARAALTTGGTVGDVLLGAGGGLGGGLAAEAAPESPTAELAGQLAGGTIVGLPALAVRNTILAIRQGQPLTRQQQTVKAALDRHGITNYLASDITASRPSAMLEAIPTRVPIGSGHPQRYAEAGLQQAGEAVGRVVRQIGPETDPRTAGLAVQQQAQQMGLAREAADVAAQQAAGQRGETFAAGLGPVLEKTAAGEVAGTSIRRGFKQFRVEANRRLGGMERELGDTPVVSLQQAHGVSQQLNEAAGYTGFATPTGTAAATRLGRPQLPAILEGLDPHLQHALMAELTPEQLGLLMEDRIPFWLARKLETKTGEIAYRGKGPIGTPAQGEAKLLNQALKQDINDFLTDPATDPSLGPRFAADKQWYATERRKYMDTVNQQAFNKNFRGSSLIDQVFNPNQPEQLLDFKGAVDDLTYQTATASKLASLFEEATRETGPAGRVFNPKLLVQKAEPYLRGKPGEAFIDRMLPPDQAQQFRQMVRDFASLQGANPTQLEHLVNTLDPERVVSTIFRPGQYSQTVMFKHLGDPAVFEQARAAWAHDVYRRSFGTGPQQEQFSPRQFINAVRPLLDSGQLDVMLADKPEALEGLKALVGVSHDRRYPGALAALRRGEALAANPSGTAQGLLGWGQVVALGDAARRVLWGLATTDVGPVASGVGEAVLTAGLPYALGRVTRSPLGVRVLSSSASPGSYSGPALRFALRVLGEGVGAAVTPRGPGAGMQVAGQAGQALSP